MNILLTAVNAKYIHSNLAVYSLRAYAEKYKKEVSIAEYTINQQTDEILADIYRRHPDILCFSCYLWNITCVKEIITEIAKILPDTEIWLGGPEVSYNPLELMEKYKMLSGIMCGEGEQTFLELTEYYHHTEEQKEIIPDAKRRDEELSRIRGIAYRKSDGTVGRTAPRPALDLSTVPFAYGHIEDFKNRIIYYE